jgi:uncharacterized protein (TIGR00661 family)
MFAKKNLESRTILICPLDWGLGHATRMVPVIREFLVNDCKVIVAASDSSLSFLKNALGKQVEYYYFPGRKITYPKGKAFFTKFIFEFPFMLASIYKEHHLLKTIVKETRPDLIISDNRYGAWHKDVISVFVTHQLFIRLPDKIRILKHLANKLNHFFIARFKYCWIPDHENNPGLSGDLSHGKFSGQRIFIGPLSRFENLVKTNEPERIDNLPDNFVLAILSGPEPQRTILENHISGILKETPMVVFRGLPGKNRFEQKGNHYWFDHPPDNTLSWYLQKCDVVICRSGYSTIMDLSVYGKKAVFIPTPGQTEQEYLARIFTEQGFTAYLSQDEINRLPEAIQKAGLLKGLPVAENKGMLKKQTEKILMEVE